MATFFEAVEPLSQVIQHFNRYDEDIIDRINHKYSTLLFCVLAIVVTTTQYVGETIKCWSPAQFTDSWVEYTDNICWISNTYYIPMSQNDILVAPRKEIVYYQWVPLVLFLQAFMFYLPCVFWYVLSRSVGINLNKIAQSMKHLDNINPLNRDKCSHYVTTHVDRALKYTKDHRTGGCAKIKQRLAQCGCFCGKRYGNFLIVIYLLTKLMYLGNSVLQLYMMNYFLGTDYLFYGVEVLRDLSTTGEYKESRRFPRVTLCDFEVRSIGKNQPFTVQCTLPINLFNEKIFIFIWFWLAFMVIINFAGIIYWFWIIFATNRRDYIKTYLRLRPDKNKVYQKKTDRKKLYEFCNKYLRQDGHFILRIISKNTSDVMVAELISLLWDKHTRECEEHLV